MAHSLALNDRFSQAIESALIHGDLKDLDTAGRVEFYNAVCRSLGLNPLTKPFAYIVLNGKLTLYALKDCTEQLRKIHGVSITAVEPKQIGELLVVVATARDGQGKVDSSTGAVSIGNLKGEALANAMMKAETKAKRRVTLSICGLGLLDESEVQTLREQGSAQEPIPSIDSSQKAEPPYASQEPGMHDEPPTPTPIQSRGKAPFPVDIARPSPVPDNGQFLLVDDLLQCVVKGVTERTTRTGSPYLAVTFNGRVDGFNHVFLFHQSLKPILQSAVNKPINIRIAPKRAEDGKSIQYFTLEDVLWFDGKDYENGKPKEDETLLKRQLKAALALEGE